MSREQLIAAAVPASVRQEIAAAYAHDPDNWWRRPSFRLWGIAMRRVLKSRGFDDQNFIPLVEQSLNLR